MSLSTCGRFFRPCLSRIRPAISSSTLNGCRLFSSLQKRPNFAICRLQAARHASDGGQASNFMSDNGLLVLGFGLLGGSVIYVSKIIVFEIFISRMTYEETEHSTRVNSVPP